VKRLLKFVLLMAALAAPAPATDVALLNNGFSIRHERRESKGAVTRLYLGVDDGAGYVDVPTEQIATIEAEKPSPSVQPELKAPTADDVVAAASKETGIDPDLISSVIQAESGFNAHAVSRKGAQGLMQLMPATAAQLGVKDSFDPRENVQGGSMYLRDLLIQNHLDLARALAAYNAGPQRVAQYHGVPPYYETHAYVSRVIRDFNRKKLAQQRATKRAHAPSPTPSSTGLPTDSGSTTASGPLSQHVQNRAAPGSPGSIK
jgi:soluble lytic murein transglycosylase-like protein